MVVELVIGYAPAAWAICVSTWTTASAPSQVVGIPGYSYLVPVGARSASGVRADFRTTALLMQEPFLGWTTPFSIRAMEMEYLPNTHLRWNRGFRQVSILVDILRFAPARGAPTAADRAGGAV